MSEYATVIHVALMSALAQPVEINLNETPVILNYEYELICNLNSSFYNISAIVIVFSRALVFLAPNKAIVAEKSSVSA